MAIRLVSFVVIVIIFAVVANTMAMTARERLAEYATYKAIGFGPGFVAGLIFGESLMITALGGGLGILATFPLAAGIKGAFGTIFPVFKVSPDTVLLQAASALVVGALAGILPTVRAARVRIVDGLRYIG
jgi:putative ABC transport system permease protein